MVVERVPEDESCVVEKDSWWSESRTSGGLIEFSCGSCGSVANVVVDKIGVVHLSWVHLVKESSVREDHFVGGVGEGHSRYVRTIVVSTSLTVGGL